MRILALLSSLAASAALSCMDESGNPVDWFAIVKYSDGTGYSYADANQDDLQPSSYNLSSLTDGAIANTLNPLFAESFALYNDEPPSGDAGSEYGHTKGVVGLDKSATSGFWLIHSVPKFPTRSGTKYTGYPSSGVVNGQSFTCVTLDGPTFADVANLLLLTRPAFYDSSLSSTVESKLPGLANVVEEGAAYLPAASNATKLQTSGGYTFQYFAKNAAWGKDVYGDLVGPTYRADLWVQTWMNGANPLPNFCTPTHKYNTLNVQSYQVNGVTIENTKDHSKWAVVVGQDDICIGGINRMQSQEARPGGTMCFVSAAMNSALKGNAVTYSTPPKGACG